jgi:predicted small lipoprotein YifL
MRSFFFRLIIVMAVFSTAACTNKVVLIKEPTGKSTAPGQVKKQTGSQSAKEYAPGQKKKD